MKWLLLALVLLAGGAGAGYWLYGSGMNLGGPAAPQPGVAEVAYDWVLAEGELLQGTTELDVPVGVNVALEIDNDVPDTLVIGGYQAEFELAADSIVPVNFYTHRKGQYPLRLKSNDRLLGTLNVVDSE